MTHQLKSMIFNQTHTKSVIFNNKSINISDFQLKTQQNQWNSTKNQFKPMIFNKKTIKIHDFSEKSIQMNDFHPKTYQN